MSQLDQLKAATTLSDVAHLLEVKPGMLSYILYKSPLALRYVKFLIPKTNGGTRKICAPNKDLKLIQHRLGNLLQNCLDENNKIHDRETKEYSNVISHGFKRKRTIMTNARCHVGQKYVFNVDLQDFFGSINFGRVRGFFLKNDGFKLAPQIATVVAQIACYDNKLPQGSPCSPVISNLIGHPLDMLLVRLATATGCTYTRYADDLTFSSNKFGISTRIATRDDTNKDVWLPGQGLKRLVKKAGFQFNPTKTRMQYRASQQEVTGLVVNEKVNVPASYRDIVRSMVHRALKTGSFEFAIKEVGPTGTVTTGTKAGRNGQLLGMLSYIDQVDLFNAHLCEANGREAPSTAGRIELFRRFLYFDFFYDISAPVIVCEGVTDNTYMKHAIKRLASAYPMLATATAPITLKVRLFKYNERRTEKVTKITGGVGGLCHLLKHYYADLTERIKAPAPKHPVIILIDNDAGAKDIYGAISGITKKPRPVGNEPFIYIAGNLYVVPTPLTPTGGPTAIEDFFDEATLKEKLGIKTFSRAKKLDETKEYGKTAFAREVIDKKALTIDFDRFSLILDRVAMVIAHYSFPPPVTAKKP